MHEQGRHGSAMTRNTQLNPLRSDQTWDVVVIGGGATGLGTAFTLLFPRRTPDDPPPDPLPDPPVDGQAEGQAAPPSTRIGAEKT